MTAPSHGTCELARSPHGIAKPVDNFCGRQDTPRTKFLALLMVGTPARPEWLFGHPMAGIPPQPETFLGHPMAGNHFLACQHLDHPVAGTHHMPNQKLLGHVQPLCQSYYTT